MANTKISAFTAETDVANITGFAAFKTVGGSSTNVKISGSEIESTLNLSNFAVGTLSVGRGGTGQTSYTDGQLLIGNTAGSLVKSTLTASTGISITNGSGSISITNSAPDQTVALTGGTGISTSGTYPNFTITNDSPNQATPAAGSSGQLQYNDGSNGFTATSDMVYTTDQLKVQNSIYLDGNGPAGGGSGSAGIVKLGCEAAGANHYVGLEGPTHGGANAYIIKFPDATPVANEILKVNTVVGSTANMTWADDANIANTNLNLNASRTLDLGASQNLTFTGSGTSKVTFSNLGGVEIARDLTVQKNVIIQGQGYSELNAMTSNTFAPDWNGGNLQSVTLTQASTFAPTNPKAGATYILIVTNTNAAITWGSYIKWAAPDTQAAPPELSGSGKTDVITLICYDDSTTNGLYYGSITKDLS